MGHQGAEQQAAVEHLVVGPGVELHGLGLVHVRSDVHPHHPGTREHAADGDDQGLADAEPERGAQCDEHHHGEQVHAAELAGQRPLPDLARHVRAPHQEVRRVGEVVEPEGGVLGVLPFRQHGHQVAAADQQERGTGDDQEGQALAAVGPPGEVHQRRDQHARRTPQEPAGVGQEQQPQHRAEAGRLQQQRPPGRRPAAAQLHHHRHQDRHQDHQHGLAVRLVGVYQGEGRQHAEGECADRAEQHPPGEVDQRAERGGAEDLQVLEGVRGVAAAEPLGVVAQGVQRRRRVDRRARGLTVRHRVGPLDDAPAVAVEAEHRPGRAEQGDHRAARHETAGQAGQAGGREAGHQAEVPAGAHAHGDHQRPEQEQADHGEPQLQRGEPAHLGDPVQRVELETAGHRGQDQRGQEGDQRLAREQHRRGGPEPVAGAVLRPLGPRTSTRRRDSGGLLGTDCHWSGPRLVVARPARPAPLRRRVAGRTGFQVRGGCPGHHRCFTLRRACRATGRAAAGRAGRRPERACLPRSAHTLRGSSTRATARSGSDRLKPETSVRHERPARAEGPQCNRQRHRPPTSPGRAPRPPSASEDCGSTSAPRPPWPG